MLSKLLAAGDGYGCDTEHKGRLPTIWEKVGVSSEPIDLPEAPWALLISPAAGTEVVVAFRMARFERWLLDI